MIRPSIMSFSSAADFKSLHLSIYLPLEVKERYFQFLPKRTKFGATVTGLYPQAPCNFYDTSIQQMFILSIKSVPSAPFGIRMSEFLSCTIFNNSFLSVLRIDDRDVQMILFIFSHHFYFIIAWPQILEKR